MVYRVILLSNGVYKKTLHRCKTRETAFINYHTLREENNVLYPKKFINSHGIKPVKYQICVTKPTEEGDTFRILRDDYGKLYTEQPLGDWTILASDEYQVEETFHIYGYESKNGERPTIKEVIKRLMINAHSKKATKQIIVVYNKLIIYNEEQFDMIICKNLEDAQRLHHTLAKIAKKQKIKSLLFMGTASAATISRMYDLIHDKTGWSYIKIRRTSTRP
ncbi:MAG: hypothetical protein E6R13_08490 [Spirochaetes bacterium]|nr:MAG: hypothetical protein E6R13_08490 [Spirochaetota bacterium]